MRTFTKDFDNIKRYDLKWQELNDLVLKSQAGDIPARQRVMSSRIPWIMGKMKKQALIDRGFSREDIWDFGLEAVCLAMEDFDPVIAPNFTFWSNEKFKGILSRDINRNRMRTSRLPEEYDIVHHDERQVIQKEEIDELLDSCGGEAGRKKIVKLFYGFGLGGQRLTSGELADVTGLSTATIFHHVKEGLKLMRRKKNLLNGLK